MKIFRVFLGITAVLYMAVVLAWYLVELLDPGQRPFINTVYITGILIVSGLSIYLFAKFLQWCFKPLE